MTPTYGARRHSAVTTSDSAAACIDVTTATRRGTRGSERLRSPANSPSAASRAFSLKNSSNSRPCPRAAHRFDAQLKLAARLVQGNDGADLDLVAVARHPAEQLVARTKHHAARLRLIVLQRKVPMTAGRACHVGNLAANPHQWEASLQQARNCAVQRGNCQRSPRVFCICDRRSQAPCGFPSGTCPHIEANCGSR